MLYIKNNVDRLTFLYIALGNIMFNGSINIKFDNQTTKIFNNNSKKY